MTAQLTLASLLLCGDIAVGLLSPRMPVWVRALLRLGTLIILTVLAMRTVGSPLHPSLSSQVTWDRLWQQLVVAGWWIVAARCAAGVARLALYLESQSRETQILSDLIGAVIYAATVIAIIDVVFDVPIGGLIATSGVVAIVIGLALQNTLADVFSGIAIDIERPYRAGDSLWVEGGIEGRVREVNWRSTLIVTGSNDVAIIPNSVMAKSRLVNHSLPTATRRASVEVRLDPRVAQDRCVATLRAAVRTCLLPVAEPSASIALTSLHGDGAVYEISFSVPSSAQVGVARTELLGQVQRHLEYAAIPMALAGSRQAPDLPRPTAEMILAHSDLFGDLNPADRELLAGKAIRVAFAEGATIFESGDYLDAFYLMAGGAVEIARQEPGKSMSVRKLGPGSCFGVIGLVTAAPSIVTATALTPVSAFRVDKRAIGDAMNANESMAAGLNDAVRRGLEAIDRAELADEHKFEPTSAVLSRMSTFLQMLSAQSRSTR